jgi:hypothetical protein
MRRLPRYVLPVIVVLAARPARADDLKRLIDKADMVLRGRSSAGVFKMEIKTKSYQRSFKIVMWDDSRDTKKERTLIKILGPALWRGHGTLKVGDSLKLFNPRTNHVTVVSHSMLGDAWMGSHFTNDDLVKETRLARHYNLSLNRKWAGKNEAGQKVTFYRVRLTPKPTAPVAWGKIVYELWERGDLVLPTKALYYRKAGAKKADRALSFSEVKKLGGRLAPSVMKMKVRKKPGEYTAVIYKTVKFDIKIPKSKFTEQALKH